MISRKTRFAALAGSVALLVSSCGREELPQNTLDPQGPVAEQLDNLIDPVFIAAGFVFVLVNALILIAAVKFRRKSDDEIPKQVHGHAALEIAWTAAPAVLLAVIGVFTLGVIFDIDERPAGANSMEVRVVGHQWWWEFAYDDQGFTTANELHIPIDTKVSLELQSVDVVHSFWPPKLAGKLDVVPGRTNHMVVEADTPGTYYGQCAEFCGLSHANMYLRVIAHEPADFDAWVRANRDEPRDAATLTGAAGRGASLFRAKGCASCHAVTGYAAGDFGPDLSHLQQREVFAGAMFELNDRNLRRWLRDPPAEKPGSLMPNLDLTEEEITDLIAYLNTLD